MGEVKWKTGGHKDKLWKLDTMPMGDEKTEISLSDMATFQE